MSTMLCCRIRLYTSLRVSNAVLSHQAAYCYLTRYQSRYIVISSCILLPHSVSVAIYCHIKLHTTTSLSISRDILSYQSVHLAQYQYIRLRNAAGLCLYQYQSIYCPIKSYISISSHADVSGCISYYP
jgi:hypothetical protein